MGLTNSKPKKPKPPKQPKPLKPPKPDEPFFESKKREEQERIIEKQKQNEKLAQKRRPPAKPMKVKPSAEPPATTSARPASLEPAQSYDQEAIDRMRNQLRGDASAFLLNNIMLSVQFFENYEK